MSESSETGFVALHSDMYLTCSSGLAPAKMYPTQNNHATKEKFYYLVKDDTATQQIGDFCCRWTLVLAAAIAAAGIVTGGAALVVLAAVAVAASAALCGGLAAPFRKWVGYSTLNAYGRKDAYSLTSKCQMVCPIGGVITYAPGITSQWQALAYTARNTGWAVLEGMLLGKLGSSGLKAFALPQNATALGNFLLLASGASAFGAAEQSLSEGMLRNGKSFSETGDEAIAGATWFIQAPKNTVERINSGYYTGGYAKDADGNDIPEAHNGHGVGAAATDAYYDMLTLASLGLLGKASNRGSIAKEAIASAKKTVAELQKAGKKFLLERGKSLKVLVAERRQTAMEFYQKHNPGMSIDDIRSHLNGIDFTKPVEIVKIKEGSELIQYTKVNTEGTVLRGDYYTDNPSNTPSQLGVSDKYNVRDPNNGWKHTDEVKTVTQEKVTIPKDAEGLKSTSAEINDTWSLKDESVHTEGGGSQIYIPKGQLK